VEKAARVHNNKYDYTNSVYTGTHTKLNIICPIHGFFSQSPNKHLIGRGCPKCGIDKISNINCGTKSKFISIANQIHSGIYNYDKVNYEKNSIKVTINCKVHGDFNQSPNSHLRGRGCPECGLIKRAKSQSNTDEEFVSKSKVIHGNRYDYSTIVYDGNEIKVNIVCNKHGIFLQKPKSHLNGNGCPKC
jgi:hypothetical protein